MKNNKFAMISMATLLASGMNCFVNASTSEAGDDDNTVTFLDRTYTFKSPEKVRIYREKIKECPNTQYVERKLAEKRSTLSSRATPAFAQKLMAPLEAQLNADKHIARTDIYAELEALQMQMCADEDLLEVQTEVQELVVKLGIVTDELKGAVSDNHIALEFMEEQQGKFTDLKDSHARITNEKLGLQKQLFDAKSTIHPLLKQAIKSVPLTENIEEQLENERLAREEALLQQQQQEALLKQQQVPLNATATEEKLDDSVNHDDEGDEEEGNGDESDVSSIEDAEDIDATTK